MIDLGRVPKARTVLREKSSPNWRLVSGKSSKTSARPANKLALPCRNLRELNPVKRNLFGVVSIRWCTMLRIAGTFWTSSITIWVMCAGSAVTSRSKMDGSRIKRSSSLGSRRLYQIADDAGTTWRNNVLLPEPGGPNKKKAVVKSNIQISFINIFTFQAPHSGFVRLIRSVLQNEWASDPGSQATSASRNPRRS